MFVVDFSAGLLEQYSRGLRTEFAWLNFDGDGEAAEVPLQLLQRLAQSGYCGL